MMTRGRFAGSAAGRRAAGDAVGVRDGGDRPTWSCLDEVIALPTGAGAGGLCGRGRLAVVGGGCEHGDADGAVLPVSGGRQGLTPVLALREAQCWLRDTTNREKAGVFQGWMIQSYSNWRGWGAEVDTRMPAAVAAAVSQPGDGAGGRDRMED